MAKAVGIDLGTTNSVIATVEGGQPTVIPNAEGARTTPSVVAFTDQGDRLVGQLARRQAILNPKGTIYSAKRFIGRRLRRGDERARGGHFDVVAGPDGAVRFDVHGKQYAPEEISALVLRKLVEDAVEVPGREGHRGGHHRPGVLQRRPAAGHQGRGQDRRTGGPAHHQRAHRGRAGLRARTRRRNETVLVFDLGGGTFDVSILDVGDGVVEVRATAGDTHLGGDDFDRRLVDHLADEFQRDNGIDLRKDPQALQRLFEAAEKAKVELSSVTQSQVNLPFITADAERAEAPRDHDHAIDLR